VPRPRFEPKVPGYMSQAFTSWAHLYDKFSAAHQFC
jgi:hypothetical protein